MKTPASYNTQHTPDTVTEKATGKSFAKIKVAVLGAGPAGLTLAERLLAHGGYEVHVYEAQAQVGGLCRSLELWGQCVDLGPHRFFTQSDEVLSYWKEHVDHSYHMVPRKTRIYYRKRFFDYPLNLINVIQQLGFLESLKCLYSFSWGFLPKFVKTSRNKINSFESYITTKFGDRLYKMFFKTYTEKLWGIDCNQLEAEFAHRKIKGLSLLSVLRSFFSKREKFYYTKGGAVEPYANISRKIKDLGGKVYLREPIHNIENLSVNENPQYKVSSSVGDSTYDIVASSIPLTDWLRVLRAPHGLKKALGGLNFRHTLLVYFLVEGELSVKDQWIYVHDKDLLFGRLTYFNNWKDQVVTNGDKQNHRKTHKEAHQKSVVCMEYWYSDDDKIDQMTNLQLTQLAKSELIQSGLNEGFEVSDSHIERLKKTYPVYERGYKENLKTIEEFLRSFKNLYYLGRSGSFSYNNQDHSVLMGMKLANSIIYNKPFRPRALTESLHYEESSLISEV